MQHYNNHFHRRLVNRVVSADSGICSQFEWLELSQTDISRFGFIINATHCSFCRGCPSSFGVVGWSLVCQHTFVLPMVLSIDNSKETVLQHLRMLVNYCQETDLQSTALQVCRCKTNGLLGFGAATSRISLFSDATKSLSVKINESAKCYIFKIYLLLLSS